MIFGSKKDRSITPPFNTILIRLPTTKMSISIAIAMNSIEEAFRSAFRCAMEKSGLEDAKITAVMKVMEKTFMPEAKEAVRESIQKAVSDSKKEKAPKDPNAPKKNRSAYQVFCQDIRDEQIPKKDTKKMEAIFGGKDNIAQAQTILKSEKIDMAEMGKLWKLVSDKGKKMYADRAEEDKARYEEEMKDYVPKPVIKAPPKAPSSAFEMYYRENCTEQWKKENDEYSTAKERRDAFKQMWEDESKETQDQYAERVKEEKIKYKQILANFEESLSEDDLKVFKAKTDKNAPKKARSAYILYSSDKRQEASELLLKENPDEAVAQTDIMRKLGQMWSNASEKEKAKYVKMAEEDKARYENEMELYKKGEFSSGSESDSDSEKESKKGKKTGYMVFVARRKIELAKENDGMSKKAIQELAVKEWKELDDDDEESGKAFWKKVASGEVELEEIEVEEKVEKKKSKKSSK